MKKEHGDWYLNLEKVSKLDEFTKKEIFHWYRDYLNFSEDGRDGIAKGLFNTLYKSGLIENAIDQDRIEKIKIMTNENN